MMQQWADYLDKLKAGAEVIPLHGHMRLGGRYHLSQGGSTVALFWPLSWTSTRAGSSVGVWADAKM